MKVKIEWLRAYTIEEETAKIGTIEEVDQLSSTIKRSNAEDAKVEKKMTKMLMGKDKIRV
jgi:hypothetical protein